MRFRKIKRPVIHREMPPVLRRVADVCPFCGAVEAFRTVSTQRRNGKIYRYSVCARCQKRVTREISVPVKGA